MKIRCLYDKLVPISELKLNPDNRNVHPKEQIERLATILKYQGWRYCVKVSNLSGMVSSGHGRVEAALLNGWDTVPVNFQDYDDADQEYADSIADNAIASWAELNLSGVQMDIKGLSTEFKLDLLGIKDFTVVEPEKIEPGCDEDAIPEATDTITQLGDCYIMGNHRLLCGDSTSIDAVEKLMNGEKADMVFTDPPYGVGYKYHSHDDNVTKEEHTQFLRDLIGLSLSICDRFILTPGCYNLDAVIKNSAPTHVGCWTKTNAMSPGRVTHFWTWEPIFFYGKWPRKRGNDVFNFPVGKQPDTGDHTCPKPIALWQEIVENFSEPKDKILDLFGGSGSTLIACEKTNRKCFMSELDPHYCDIIVARWEKYSGKKAVLLPREGDLDGESRETVKIS